MCAVENAEECLDERLRHLCEELRAGFQYYEILLVDNASTDGTAEVVRQILQQEKNIQYCVLSSPKSDSVAFSAGLDRAIGDFIILMDPRTDPPELIPRMLELATSGSEIVYGLPRERVRGRGLYDRLARLFLQLIARFNDVDVPQAAGLSRPLVHALDHRDACDQRQRLAGKPCGRETRRNDSNRGHLPMLAR